MTNKPQPFRRAPYWEMMVGCRRLRRCSPKITHNIYGNQANNNTKINIGHKSKNTEVNLCHSKVVLTNIYSLSYPKCFNVSRVHPLARALFPTNPIPDVPLAGTLKFFYSNWAKLMQDLNILNIVQGFEIPFLENPVQEKSPNPPVLNQEQTKLVREELKEMLLRGAIQPVWPCKNQYLSNLFLVSKRDWCNRPVINLKHLTHFIQYQYFKMEGLNLLQNMVQKGDCMCKLRLKDAYFCFPLKKESRKYVRFQWEGTLYEFLCLCFGLGSASLILTKILKVPISLLRSLQILVIIYISWWHVTYVTDTSTGRVINE